jgi:hypothetical protein
MSESELELIYDWRFTANRSGCQATQDQRLFFLQMNPCVRSPCVTFSLTRGCVCRLQFLLALTSAFTGPSHAGLMTIFYCLRFETPTTWKAKSPYLYPQGTGWPSYTPKQWAPFSSPFTIDRATVEVLKPAST